MTSIQSAAYEPPKTEDRMPIDDPLIGVRRSGVFVAAFHSL